MTVSGNPALTQDPVLSQVLMRILELSGAGISPVDISSAISEKNKQQEMMQAQQMQQQQPQAQPKPLSLTSNPA
jgi:hypothetical protein